MIRCQVKNGDLPILLSAAKQAFPGLIVTPIESIIEALGDLSGTTFCSKKTLDNAVLQVQFQVLSDTDHQP